MGNPTSYFGKTLAWDGKQLRTYSWSSGTLTAAIDYRYDENGLRTQKIGSLSGMTTGTVNYYYNGSVLIGMQYRSVFQRFSYAPTTGRFISADVYLSTGQGVIGHNAFAYCLNNPAAMADSAGNRPFAVMLTDSGWDGDPDLLSTAEMGFYESEEAAAKYVAPKLYMATKRDNVEYMAPIYSVKNSEKTLYLLGQICKGKHDNVVGATLGSYFYDTFTTSKTVKVSLVGFVHSHPYCNGHIYSEFSGLFGDEGAALLTGSCYLIEPSSRTLYKVSRYDVISSFVGGYSISSSMNSYRIYSYDWLPPYLSKNTCR